MKQHAARQTALLIGALAVFYAVGMLNLSLPGLQYDEAADAVPAMEWLQGRSPSTLSTVRLFGLTLPGMMLHHIGPTSVWTSALGFLALGVSPEALRITQLCVGATALLLLWLLARRWMDDRSALIAVWLCATHPAMIWWSRAGANWTVPLLPISLALALALTRWWRTRAPGALIAAGFLIGAGLMTKILFVWWLPVLAAVAALSRPPGFWLVTVRQTPRWVWPVALVAMCAGAWPLILHNVPDLATFRFVLGNALQTRIYGHNNLDVAGNLATVLGQWLRMIGGDTMAFGAPADVWPFGALIWVCALAVTAVAALRARRPRDLWLALAPVLILPMSTISTSSIGATYVFMLVPFAFMTVAGFLSRLPRRGALTVAVLIIAAHLATNARVLAHFERTGGVGWWSSNTSDIVQALEGEYAGRPVVALDWGFRRNIALLARGRLDVREIIVFTPDPPPEYDALCAAAFETPGTLFLAHEAPFEAFKGRVTVCWRAAFNRGLDWVPVQRFPQRDGTPNATLYVAQPAPALSALPAGLRARNAEFSTGVTLLGGAVDRDGADLTVRLFFRAGREPLPDDVVLVHVVRERDGAVVLAADQRPRSGWFPMPAWRSGEIVEDRHWLTLPEGLEGGVYQIRVGVYDAATGARRRISDPQNDAAGDSLRLDGFWVE